tara:strand:- start:1126 stop:1434 length:309 start_codon:yes stop_codon:yes gene_type:complete
MKAKKTSKIVLEYCASEAVKVKRVPLKGSALHKAKKEGKGTLITKRTEIKNPKAWRVVYTENHAGYLPGQYLPEHLVKLLCESTGTEVVIGEQGFFNKDNRW